MERKFVVDDQICPVHLKTLSLSLLYHLKVVSLHHKLMIISWCAMSIGVVNEAKESTEPTPGDDTDRNLLSMFDKYLNGQLKHFDDFDEDEDEVVQDETKDNMNESVNEFTANYFQSARKQRKPRRSSVFSSLLNSSRSKSALEVVQLLRHYYEEERNQTLLSSFVESKVELPVDFDKLTVDDTIDEMRKLIDEITQLKVSIPKQIIEHHKGDLEQLIKILHDSKDEVMKKTSQSSQVNEIDEESDMKDLTKQVRDRIRMISELQSTARDRLEDLETLLSVESRKVELFPM